MQALILVGGEGTRLRPLTSTVPKPVVPLVDRPFLAFMLEWLRQHGVDRVVLSCGSGRLARGVREVLGEGEGLGVRLEYVEEPEPLGTGGALKFAEDRLDERFLMLNGDVLTDIDLSAQLEQHERTGARGTLALTAVADPSSYGLVRTESGGEVTAFVEKPAADQVDTNRVNAGVYVLERSVLELMEPGEAASIERDVFPRLVGEGLYGSPADGYWLDIGTPERYLTGTFDLLDGTVKSSVELSSPAGGDGRVVDPALVADDCEIGDDARLGGRVVVQDGVSVGAGSTVERAVVLRGAQIGAGCSLHGCIVGPGARIGEGCRIDGLSVIGEGVRLGAGNVVSHGARLFSGLDVPDHSLLF